MIRENQSLLNKINVLSDMLLTFAAILLSYWIRFFLFPVSNAYLGLNVYLRLTLLILPAELLIYGFFDLYGSFRVKPFSKECSSILWSNVILAVFLLSVLFLSKYVHISRWLVVWFVGINSVLTILKRYCLRKALFAYRAKGKNLKSLILIGAGKTASDFCDVVRSRPEYGYNYLGFLSERETFIGDHLGNYSDLYQVLNRFNPDEVVCALDVKDSSYLPQIVSDCEKTGTKISIIPFSYEYIPSHPYIDEIGRIPLLNLRRIPLDNVGNAFLKRLTDIVISFLLLAVLSPLLLLTAILVKATSPGPVIFRQTRIGLNKRPFTMYKFRSMRVNDRSDTAWSTDTDSRRTGFGSFIRKCSIDELPQLWNVLIGDMSLVGPRPELPHFVEEFRETVPLYMVKHQVKPGITGLAQVKGYRGDTSIRKRIECDIDYIENWSYFLDWRILFLTLFKSRNSEKTNYGSKEVSK